MNTPAGAVIDHFRAPRNVGRFPADAPATGRGTAGSAITGDMITMSLRFDGVRIAEARFQAFGCASLIAAGSLATERVLGLQADEATRFDPQLLVRELELADERMRFAELALQAVTAAVADWRRHGIEQEEKS